MILSYSLSYQLPLVIGTTGYTQSQFQEMEEHAKQVPVMYSANFSLGIMVMNQLIKQAAAMLQGWQIELIEKHHSRKKMHHLVPRICFFKQSKKYKSFSLYTTGKDKKRRKSNWCTQYSCRFFTWWTWGNVCSSRWSIYDQTWIFSNRIFAAGAVEAADWLKNQPPGYYKLEDLLMDKGV